jgi:hypothetical protein
MPSLIVSNKDLLKSQSPADVVPLHVEENRESSEPPREPKVWISDLVTQMEMSSQAERACKWLRR